MTSTSLNPLLTCRSSQSHLRNSTPSTVNQLPHTPPSHSCGAEHASHRLASSRAHSASNPHPLTCAPPLSHAAIEAPTGSIHRALSARIVLSNCGASRMKYGPRSRTPWGKITGLEAILYNSSKTRRTPLRTYASREESEGSTGAESGSEVTSTDLALQKLGVLVSALLTVIFAVSNRVLYKMALVPLKEYPFFLAQVTTFGYVAVYFSVLMYRRRLGIVTEEMMSFPKRRFAAMGALEAVGLASGMAAAAMLPGALIPILGQVFIVWQLLMSYVILGKRYTLGQVAGCLLVIAGVILVVASGSGAGESLQGLGLFWPMIMIVSAAFPAGASILKEGVFREAAYRLKGGSLDLFVVNSFGSGFQALFVFLLLPLLSRMRGIPFNQLPAYFSEGTACFLNMGAVGSGCEGAPLLPLAYVACNLAFNVAALNLLKRSSAVVASLSITLAVPLTVAAFTMPLPYLGSPAPLPPGFFSGSLVLILGLALYNFGAAQKLPPSSASKED